MKKMIGIFKILIIFIVLLVMQPNIAMADIQDAQEIITDGFFGWYLQDDTHMDIEIELGGKGASSSKQMTERILGILQILGSVLSVIALLVIGFRYMFSSLEEKAAMKNVIIYYIVGAVLVFATSNILGIAYKVISDLKL